MFELYAVALATNQGVQLREDGEAAARGRRMVARLLGDAAVRRHRRPPPHRSVNAHPE